MSQAEQTSWKLEWHQTQKKIPTHKDKYKSIHAIIQKTCIIPRPVKRDIHKLWRGFKRKKRKKKTCLQGTSKRYASQCLPAYFLMFFTKITHLTIQIK